MASTSNYGYVGYQAWAWRSGFTPSLDTKGPWFNYTAYADTEGTLLGIQARSTGKAYFEFNFRRASTTETEYCFGLVTGSHDPDTDLPGFSAESWALCTESIGFYHDSTQTTTSDSYINALASNVRGWYYDYRSYVTYSGYVVKVAIDFDAGKIWFGVWNGSLEFWDGDPAAGTDPTYTFTPNTPLYPAVGYKFTHTGFLCTAIVELGCSRDFARRNPPSGFTFWEEFDYQAEVLADNPAGYWMASPHIYGETFVTNSLGYPGLYGDSSVNQKYTEHYNGSAYNFLTADASAIFSAAPAYRWYAAANSSFGKYPVSLSSTSSFTLEASVYITGAGAVNDTADVWTEGSGLVTNYIQANQQASWTLGQSWVGIALRDYRFKFHLREYEVTAGSDVSTGAHHIMAVFDASAQTLTLYIDGTQAGQTTSVTPTSASTSWLAWGALRPNQTNGNFPGYFRDCAFYPSALSSTRVTAHYDALSSTDVELAGSPTATVSVSGDLISLADLAAAASALATAAGDLYTTVLLAGSAGTVSTATGDLEVPPLAISLDGVAVAESTASGDLSPHPLAGSAQAVSTAAGTLASLISLTTEARTSATAAGDPDVLVAIAGAATALATASAALGQAVLLAGDAAALASAAANATMQTGMAGGGEGQASASGSPGVVSDLAGDAAALATLNGALNQSMAIAGTAQAVADAAGALSNAIGLSGGAVSMASVTGSLSVSKTIAGKTIYAVNIQTGAVTTWENLEFERVISAHGKFYGLKDGTLYRMEGDTDPSDAAIAAKVRFASSSFGLSTLGRLTKVYVESRATAGMHITPIYDESLGYSYLSVPSTRNGMSPHKCHVGRGNRFSTLGLIIGNEDGGPLDIGAIEPIIYPLSRRIR